MPFNTKFTPSQHQDRDQYNEHVLNERYATVKSLRESYSHIYQELTNLRNNLQDFKAEQDNQPELATAEADRIRYNNEIENRYLALKSIQLNTSYPDEYGHTIRPFSENKAAEQLRLHCNYMISGSHHFKQYHLAKTSCIELNQDTSGENIKEYNSASDNMLVGKTPASDVTFTAANILSGDGTAGQTISTDANKPNVFKFGAVHGLELNDQIYCTVAGGAAVINQLYYVVDVVSTTEVRLSTSLGGTVVTIAATLPNASATKFTSKKNSSESVTITFGTAVISATDALNGKTVTLSGFTDTYAVFNSKTVTVTDSTTTTIVFTHDAFGIDTNNYTAANDNGLVSIGQAVEFPFKKFYLNKLDATNSAAVYGNGTQTFNYSDNYVTDLAVIEGHIYLLNTSPNGNDTIELDGRQTASVLGRNVQNLENMIEIVANYANATEQALDRIVQIAELVGVEINHD